MILKQKIWDFQIRSVSNSVSIYLLFHHCQGNIFGQIYLFTRKPETILWDLPAIKTNTDLLIVLEFFVFETEKAGLDSAIGRCLRRGRSGQAPATRRRSVCCLRASAMHAPQSVRVLADYRTKLRSNSLQQGRKTGQK